MVVGLGQQTSLVQQGNDAHGLLLDQLANNVVVEVLDGGPFDAFAHVLFLLALEGQLNEHLLQLLVTQVDAELLEAVALWRWSVLQKTAGINRS